MNFVGAFALCGAIAAVGPILDPLTGETVPAADREALPAARHMGDMADMWFLPLTNMQVSSGGLEMFDPTAVSAHGLSWAHVHVRLNALDITDPARPGAPLVHLPYDAWDTLTWRSLWTDQPGFTYSVRRPDKSPADLRIKLRYGTEVGGGVWIPRHVFDRDPAFGDGAPSARRALRDAYEAVVVANTDTFAGPLRIVVEGLAHAHHYLTLTDTEGAQRLSALAAWQMPRVGGGAEILLLWQGQQRDFEGAEFRWPEDWTLRTRSQGVVGQASVILPLTPEAGKLHLALGAGWREETERPRSDAAHAYDITDAWTWMARPHLAQDMQRFRADAQLRWLQSERFDLRLVGQVAGVTTVPRFGDGRITETYNQVAVRQTVWEGGNAGYVWQSLRAEASYRPDWRFAELEGVLAMDVAAVQDTGALSIDSWAPAIGLSARRRLGDHGSRGEVFALLRREPVPLDGMLMGFLNTGGQRGATYGASETGTGPLIARHGGDLHGLADGLLRPSANQLALGYRTPAFGPFVFVIQGVGRWLALRHTVALADKGGWSPVPFDASGHDAPDVYARDPASFGTERYLLVNDDKLMFFTGTEFQIYTLPGRPWFLNLGGAAYIAAGRAPFGSFFDRNDPGVIDESSAGPNAQINAFGRYDQDRSFTLKLLAGIRPFKNLSIALAARYRDGQPFARTAVAQGLPQGAEVIMAERRGRRRHTFAMIWDVRVRYDWLMAPYVLALGLDVYNFWGSATEILEDPRTGPGFRRPLETVPDRAVLFSVEIGRVG